jgi:hypothetical protein
MKSNFMLIALLFSILFLCVNVAAFAQDQVAKDSSKDISTPKPVTGNIIAPKQDTTDIITNKEINKDIVKKNAVTEDITTKTDATNIDTTTVAKDIVVGKTANGETIYQDIKGGKYTLSVTGKKVYIKKIPQ